MLKIKDNVDLKELEKFGLKLEYEINPDTGESWVEYVYKLRGDENISLNYSILFRRLIQGEHIIYGLGYIEITDINILYDLIKADLVEKSDE